MLAPHLRNYFNSVSDLRIEGESRISFFCREPYFRNDLMLGSFSIIPKHFYDSDGLLDQVSIGSLIDGTWKQGEHAETARAFARRFNRDFNRAVLGSGPYLVEEFERDVVTQQKVVLTRNRELLGPGQGDRSRIRICGQSRLQGHQQHRCRFHRTDQRQPRHVPACDRWSSRKRSWTREFQQRFLKVIQYGGGFTYIGWNNAHPLFRDRRVRQAMSCLTDRQGMIGNLLFGLGESVAGPIHKFRPEYNHDLEIYPYDPERALDLLEEAGWEDADGDGILDKMIDGERVPFSFEFLINSGNQMRKDIALIMQSELRDIGIECQVRELDWSIFLQRVRSRDFAAMTLGWTGNVRFPPDGYQIWHSFQVESGSNYIGFINAEVDEILKAYRREFDPDRRIALYHRFQEILHEEQPYTFLWKGRNALAYSRRYQGVNWYPGGDRSSIAENSLEWWVHAGNRQY